jgi:endonuclease-3
MKGAYVLLIEVNQDLKVKKFEIQKGFYFYVGSALGKSINLENRVSRHFKKEKRLKWHIDFLLAHPKTNLKKVLLIPSEQKLECKISNLLQTKTQNSIKGFGCSDCKCFSHLHGVKNEEKATKIFLTLSRSLT